MATRQQPGPFDKPKVFISYARRDGEPVANDMRSLALAALPDVEPWMDHYDMEGDQGWWKQITDAIDGSWAAVLVLTPAALKSKVVAKEWLYARRQGVPVVPVKGVPDAQIDYTALPEWMSSSHIYDLKTNREGLLAHLKNP